jgi:hypothetical protein
MSGIIRMVAYVVAFWMIFIGIVALFASLSSPMPELGPLAALVGVVLGILLLLALWAFPSSGRQGRAYGDDDD